MKITQGHITEELLCAMRVHLMNETEMHIFCPKDVRIWEENCHNVEFLNFTAISVTNELSVIGAFRTSLHRLLDSYPTSSGDDEEILKVQSEDKMQGRDRGKGGRGGGDPGPILTSVVRLRLREKNILLSALYFLEDHERAVDNGTVPFQLELKAQERLDANRREEERQQFILEVQRRAVLKVPLAVIEVNMGEKMPKVNLTLEEGESLHDVVSMFCRQHGIGEKDLIVLENALSLRVKSPTPLSLLLGVVLPSGERKILGIQEGKYENKFTIVFEYLDPVMIV